MLIEKADMLDALLGNIDVEKKKQGKMDSYGDKDTEVDNE